MSSQRYSEPRFCMRLISITEHEIEVILSALPNKLSSGIDRTSNTIATTSSFAIVPLLKNSLNYS